MLALAATNLAGALLFAALYAAAGARVLPAATFPAALLGLFLLMTILWVRVERRHAALDAVRRLGRVAVGLVLGMGVTVIGVLMPLFWIESHLPPEAGLTTLLAPIMSVLLVALVLTAVVNLAGAVASAGLALVRRRRRPA